MGSSNSQAVHLDDKPKESKKLMGISNGHVIHLDNKLKESIKFFLLKDSNINKSNIKENTALIKNITILFDNKINGKLIEILPFKNQFLQIEYISRYYLHKIINIKTIYVSLSDIYLIMTKYREIEKHIGVEILYNRDDPGYIKNIIKLFKDDEYIYVGKPIMTFFKIDSSLIKNLSFNISFLKFNQLIQITPYNIDFKSKKITYIKDKDHMIIYGMIEDIKIMDIYKDNCDEYTIKFNIIIKCITSQCTNYDLPIYVLKQKKTIIQFLWQFNTNYIKDYTIW